MPNVLIDLEVERVDLVNEGANSEAFIRLYKRKESGNTMDLKDIIASLKPEHAATVSKAIDDAMKEVTTANAIAKQAQADLVTAQTELQAANTAIAKAAPEEPNFEEVLKGLDPSVQKAFKALQDQKEAAESIAKAAAEKTLNDQAIAKAKELASIPVAEEKLVSVLKGASTEIVEILKAANAAIEKAGVLEEVGIEKGAEPATTSEEAWAQIEKAAAEYAASAGTTVDKAVGVIIKQKPELYSAYLKGGTK